MRVADMHWRQVEDWLARDDRCVLPVGAIEQHAQLSLATDTILAERVAAEAAEPLGVPVFPPLAYGLSPYFTAYPGTVSIRAATLLALVKDILDGLHGQGFRRVLIVNGHGGNAPVAALVEEWLADHADGRVLVHDWWKASLTLAEMQRIDPLAGHASWMENFAWTRLADTATPEGVKPLVDRALLRGAGPVDTRAALGDGSFGGAWRKPDAVMAGLWAVAVAETRALIEGL